MSSASHSASHSKQQYHSHASFYIGIFLFLSFLTIVTVAVSRYDFGMMNLVVAMVIASIKAGLVALFFMHLSTENPLTWLYAAFPIVLLFILIGLVFLDEPLRVVPTGIRESGKAGPVEIPWDNHAGH